MAFPPPLPPRQNPPMRRVVVCMGLVACFIGHCHGAPALADPPTAAQRNAPAARPESDPLLPLVARSDAAQVEAKLSQGAAISLQTFLVAGKSKNATIIASFRKHAAGKPENAGITLIDEMRTTPAAAKKRIEAADFDVNKPLDSFGFLPLNAAAHTGSTAMAKLLLERGAKVDFADARGPAVIAVEEKHSGVLSVLLTDKGAGEPGALMGAGAVALRMRNTEALEALIKAGLNVDEAAPGRGGASFFDTALVTRNPNLLAVLAEAPAKAGQETAKLRRQYLAAMLGGSADDMDRAVAQKFDAKSEQGILLRAVTLDAPAKSVTQLLKHGVVVTVEAVVLAERTQRNDLVMLMSTHAEKAAAKPKENPLYWLGVVRKGAAGVAKAIEEGMDVNAKIDANEWTPLHSAVAANSPDSVRALLKAGAKANAADKLGRSPRDIVTALLDPNQYGAMHAALSGR